MYELAPYVSACTPGRSCIFLDLKHDRYIAVDAERMRRLAPLLSSSHIESDATDFLNQHDGTSMPFVQELITAGLLRNAVRNDTPRPPLPPTATRDLGCPDHPRYSKSRPRHRLSAVLAMMRADLILRRTALWRIADRIRTAKVRPVPGLFDPPPWEIDSITSTFLHLRPWYPRNYLCLYDSFALMLLLGAHRINADWVFGVREDPFLAHCWVQHNSVVLNDQLDRIRLFVPIMAI